VTGKKTTPTYDELVSSAYVNLGLDATGDRAKKAPRGDPEHQLQKALIALIRVWDKHANGGKGAWIPQPLALKYPDLMDLYANANWAGVTGPKQGAVRKAEGVLVGVSDLFLPVPMLSASMFHGLYLETKVPGSRPRPEQIAFLERMVARGYAGAVWRELEQGTDMLIRYCEGVWRQTPELLK
jgi:hypothetical protein